MGSPTGRHVPSRCPQLCSVGECPDPECMRERRVPGRVDHGAINPELAFGLKPGAGHPNLPIRQAEHRRRHLTGRECAGLVRADDCRRPECLDDGQVSDQRAAAGHSPTPTAIAIVPTTGRPSGTAATASAMAVSSSWPERRALPGAEARDEYRNGDGNDGEPAPERVEAPLQRGALLHYACRQLADAADLGVHCRRHHDRACRPRDDARGLVDHRAAVRERYVGGYDCQRALGHRARLAGKCGLGSSELGGLQ